MSVFSKLAICSAILFALSHSDSLGEEAIPPKPFLQAKDGETIVFFGDSITHQCLYTQYIETFFYTRFPDRNIQFHNAGVSGDKATDALARFEDDLAVFEPDHVTVLLGMNDGQYEPFTTETFTTYREGIEKIVSQIKELGATPIALSPTMFDHHQLALRNLDETFRFRNRSFDQHYNSLMAFYGAWLRETSGHEQIPFVNLWGPLNDHTFAIRSAKPDFSLVEDAIHPGAAGQFIMAFSILSASQAEKRHVSNISINRRGDKWTAARSEKITGLIGANDSSEVSFTFHAESLPWVVPDRSSKYDLKWGPSAPASLGFELTKAGHKLGAERLRITGLAPGNYELHIDDTKVGTFTHLQLGAKIELQKYPATPQSQQALEIAELNRERNDEAVRPLRDTWAKIKGLRRRGDQENFQAEYPKLLAQARKLEEKATQYHDQIREIARPIPRQYRLVKVTVPAKPKAKARAK